MLKSAFTSLAVLAAAAAFPSCALAGTAVQTYSTEGETPFVVPQGVHEIHIDAVGGAGGSGKAPGGAGAEVQGDLAVAPGQTLFLEVGIGRGPGDAFGGVGGGESDVRACSVSATSCTVLGYPASSAQTRMLVAGGGGGGADGGLGGFQTPGAGGNAGLLGASAQDGENGGAATGGTGATSDGAGTGGNSYDTGPGGSAGDTAGLGFGGSSGADGGGGGAGYHGGGGGGGVTTLLHGAGGGGGGSSWVNQDQSGVDAYLTHVTGASSALGSGLSRITLTYTDDTPPALTLADPSDGAQFGAPPYIQGVAGTDSGDAQTVTLSIYRAHDTTGSPVQTLTGNVLNGGLYAVQSTGLASGSYTVVASQSDAAGNVATASRTFSVDTTPPAVAITDPVNGASGVNSTAIFAGTLGTEPKDAPVVAVGLFTGTDTATSPILTGFATVSGADWSIAFPGQHLSDGVYTLVVYQNDNGRNVGTAQSTFTVGNPPAGSSSGPGGPGTPGTGGGTPGTGGGTPGAGTGTPGTQTPGAPGTGTPGPQTATAGTSTATHTSARLQVLVSHLRKLVRGCTQHPRPRHLHASACSTTAFVSGSIDRHAAGQRLTITWRDGRGHVVHATAVVGTTGSWSAVLRLPGAARVHRGSVLVTYAGGAALLPASVQAAIARAH